MPPCSVVGIRLLRYCGPRNRLAATERECAVTRRDTKTPTILHFCCDVTGLMSRAKRLTSSGYRVLNSSNGFEAIELCNREPVDAVVLELDRNRAEIALIARQIKQFRPKVPTIVLTEAAAPFDGANDLADALVPKENHPELVKSLAQLLAPPAVSAV